MALTQGQKFREPLDIVDKKINPTEEIKSFYHKMMEGKGKNYKIIEFNYNPKELTKFSTPTNSNKKYHKYDLRKLKSEGVDEIFLVNVNYGILISYYGVIETGKLGYCKIDSEIINLMDNSLIYKDFSEVKEKINGNWKTPPDYKNLEQSIQLSIGKSIDLEKTKYN